MMINNENQNNMIQSSNINQSSNQVASALPVMALDEIPTPNMNAQTITGLVKESGRVTGYQLSDGRIVDKQEGVSLAKHGGIQGVGVAHRNGTEYLKSIPDGTESNNLSNLPSVSSKK